MKYFLFHKTRYFRSNTLSYHPFQISLDCKCHLFGNQQQNRLIDPAIINSFFENMSIVDNLIYYSPFNPLTSFSAFLLKTSVACLSLNIFSKLLINFCVHSYDISCNESSYYDMILLSKL